MYSNDLVRHLLDDLEMYRRRNYDANIKVEIYFGGNNMYSMDIDDEFKIVGSDMLLLEEEYDGVPLRAMVRCDSITSYNFYIPDEDEEDL